MKGFWIRVYISRRHLFVKVSHLGLLEVLWKFLKDNSLRFLWYSKNQKFSPLNPHSSRGSFYLCTFLRSFWIFQTVFENNLIRFLWHSKNSNFTPLLNPHPNRVSFPLCTFLCSFWIFQTVCCELQLFVQSKRLPPQLSQYISNSPTPCIYIFVSS